MATPTIDKCAVMTDHFEGIDKLVKEAPHTEGAPNFRRVRYWYLFSKYSRVEDMFIRT